MKKLTIMLIGVFALIRFCVAAEVELPNRLALLTENYGQYNYSLTGRQFEHKSENIGGSSTEFVKLLLARANIPYVMKLRTWRVSYERALNKPNYGVFSTARTELRENLFDWVGPIARYNWVIIVKSDNNIQINNLDDLHGLKIGGYTDDALTQFVESKGIEVSALPNESVNAQLLHENLIDAWVSSDATAFQIAEASGHTDIKVAYVIRTVDMYLAMNKGSNPEWLTGLHNAYKELVAEGKLELKSY